MAKSSVKKEASVEAGESSQKLKAAMRAVEQIQERFGAGSIMKMGETTTMDVDVVPTGAISLDIALGAGGVPKGRIVEIYGPESSGKTTLAQHIVAEVQKRGGTAAFIDAEHALDPKYAKNIGINVDELLISQPDTGEQALEILDTLVQSNAVDVVVVDSVAALVPQAEIEGDMGDSHMGLQARLMSQALRKLTGSIKKSNCIVIFINQIRMKIGVMFGNPETTAGGQALKFYASVRLEIRRRATIKRGEEMLGNRVKVKVAKNKIAAPFQVAEFDIMFSEGISREGDLIDTGVLHGVVQKAGSWYMFEAEKLGQGREAAKTYLKENKKTANAVEKAIWKKVRENLKKDKTEIAA